jgi:hypothetical protein
MSIDVISNMRLILGAATNSLGRIFIPPTAGNSAEILAHEVAHAYHYKYNSSLGATTQLFAGAVMEGMADTIAGLYGARQIKVLNRLLDGFEGKLTTSKWAKLTKCSQDTAYRDILDLVERGALMKDPGGGRSTSYSLAIDG